MTFKLLATIFILLVLGSSVLSQADYSESKSYKPRPSEKQSDTKKKSDKNNKDASAEPVPVVVPMYEDVTIPISVFDKLGGVVGGIKKEDVTVLVDGVQQTIIDFVQEKEPPVVLLVMDSSPSAKFSFEKMRERAMTLVDALPANVKIAIIEFDTEMRLLSQPTAVRADTRAALTQTQMRDGTAIYTAISNLYKNVLSHVPSRTIVVMFTDGVDTTSKGATFNSSLAEVAKKDVSLYSVYFDTQKDQQQFSKNRGSVRTDDLMRAIQAANPGLVRGSSAGEYEKGLEYLESLSVASGGRMFRSDKLEDVTKSFSSELSSRYYARIKVEKKSSAGHEIRVRINRPNLTVVARGSFVDE